MSRWRWMLMQMTRRLWARATLIGCLGVAAAILAAVVERFIPWEFPTSIGADAVGSILNIIASSMLAVTTFSLSVMTAAYGSATSNVTPRAAKLLMEDRVTQTVLSSFLGSFLFSIVGIVVLKTGAYGERGRFILFVVTIIVIVLIVVSLLRWIDHLTRLGRVGETTARVEQAARKAIEARLQEPYLGGRLLSDPEQDVPVDAQPVMAGVIGYVQYVDMAALSQCGSAIKGEILVAAIPGTFVYPNTAIAWISKHEQDEDSNNIAQTVYKAFSIDNERSFDQDPRFGLAVLSEIGSRALSPATNDPGTAIDVISRMARLMSLWAGGASVIADDDIRYPNVRVSPLKTEDLFEDAFMLIARDGAHLIEIQLRLQKTLIALSQMGDKHVREAALYQAKLARERAEIALTLDSDKSRLQAVVDSIRY